MTVADIVDFGVFASPVGDSSIEITEVAPTVDATLGFNWHSYAISGDPGTVQIDIHLVTGYIEYDGWSDDPIPVPIKLKRPPSLYLVARLNNIIEQIDGDNYVSLGPYAVWDEENEIYDIYLDKSLLYNDEYIIAVFANRAEEISKLARITFLSDNAKWIKEVHITNLPYVKFVDLGSGENIEDVDVSGCRLASFDFTGLSSLNTFDIRSNNLSSVLVDAVLGDLSSGGYIGSIGTNIIRIDDNSQPTSAGFSYKDILVGNGWTVFCDSNELGGPFLHASWKCNEQSGDIIDYGYYAGNSNFDFDFAGYESPGYDTGKIYSYARSVAGGQYFYTDNCKANITPGGSDPEGFSGFAIEAWIKPTSIGDEGRAVGILVFDSNLYMGMMGTRKIYWVLSTGAESTITLYSDPIELDEWHQVIISYDNHIYEYKFIVDGIAYYKTLPFQRFKRIILYIGTPVNEKMDYYTGLIGPVRMWGRALSSEQTNALWNSGSGISDDSFEYQESKIIIGTDIDILTGSPLAFWKCNEGTYGTIYDSVGTTDILPTSSSAESNTGKLYDYAVCYVESASQYHSASSASTIQLSASSDFTVEAWIQPSSLPATGDTATIISHNDNWSLELLPTAKVRWNIHESASTQYVDSNNAISTGCGIFDWHHLLSWYDESASRMYLQVDDQSIVDNPNTDMITFAPTDSQSLYLGWGGNSGAGYFDGAIGPVRLWNCIFSASERDALYNDGDGLDLPVGLITATLRSDS